MNHLVRKLMWMYHKFSQHKPIPSRCSPVYVLLAKSTHFLLILRDKHLHFLNSFLTWVCILNRRLFNFTSFWTLENRLHGIISLDLLSSLDIMFPRFSPIIACNCCSNIFTAVQHCILWKYYNIFTYSVTNGLLGNSQVLLLQTCMEFSLGYIPLRKLSTHRVGASSTLQDSVMLFPKWLCHFTFLPPIFMTSQ